MSGLREQVAFAISHGNMAQAAGGETAEDLIGALAMSDRLGAALWRVTGALDAGSFRVARELLHARLMAETTQPHALVWRVATLALEEWLACLCQSCQGRGFVAVKRKRVACNACGGTGRGRLLDSERMAKLHVGCATYSKLTALLDRAHDCITTADRLVEQQIASQLERKSLKFGNIFG